MPIGDARAHLGDALRWSRHGEFESLRALIAGLGMAAPAAVGVATGHPQAGMAAAVGAMVLAGVALGPTGDGQARALLAAVLSIAAAAVAVSLLSGWGLLAGLMVALLAGLATLAGGYRYGAAVAATRFVLFLVLLGGLVGDRPAPGWSLLVLVLAGAIWATVLGLLAGAGQRRYRPGPTPSSPRAPSRTALWRRWRRSLATLEGWRYPLTVTIGLLAAALLQALWPQRDLHWIAITVAIVAERRPAGALSVKTTQRALGTALGVLLAGLFLHLQPPGWLLVMGIGLLAAARPLLRWRNYLAYSVVMTPLLVLMMDAGQAPGPDLLRDRLVATLIGAALVVAMNALFAAHRWTVLPGTTT